MSYTVVYWNRATDDVYEVIRSEMPAGWTLITPQRETPEACRSQLGEADFALAAVWAIGEPSGSTAGSMKRWIRLLVLSQAGLSPPSKT